MPALLYYASDALKEAERYLRLALVDIERYGHRGTRGMMKYLVLNELLADIQKRAMDMEL